MIPKAMQLKIVAPVSSLLILITCFVALATGNFFTDLFNPGLEKIPKFSGSQLYNLSAADMGLGGIDGYIGCFGDFNSDKYTDLFVISGNENNTAVDVYLWDSTAFRFTNSSASVKSPYITNIAAGDFDYDGNLDLLVSGFLNTTSGLTYVNIYKGDLVSFSDSPVSSISASSQVSVLDVNNDLKLDLYGEIPVGTNPAVSQRAFWINTGNATFSSYAEHGDLLPLRGMSSNAFVDINGDCLADRVVTSQGPNGSQYEIWINGKTNGYTLHHTMPLPPGAGQITFSDFDRDGTIDLIIPVCYPAPNCTLNNSIIIVFNKQKPVCGSLLSRSSTCRSSTALCDADPNFQLGMLNASSPDPLVAVVPTSDFTTGHFYFDWNKGRTLMLRVGDYNLDGYPDILVPIADKDGATRIELWQNVDGSGNNRRSFQRVNGGVEALTSIPNAYAAAFFDLAEDGVPDIFVLADNPPRIETVYNNFENDAFFLKALGLNGVCPEWCPSSPKFPSPKPYGVNFAGSVFKFIYTDLSGASIVETGSQLPQSTYHALYTPYILFGLGRTSNYIEQFFLGVPLNQSVHYNYWTGSTIPNSQVVAIPYKPDNPSSWTLELYITPSGLLFWIMVTLIATLLILAVTVFGFYRKEKKEDELKKQEQAHLFSFDAL